MAMLDEAVIVMPDTAPQEITESSIKEAIARQAWAWYYMNQAKVVLKVRVWFINKDIRVRDLGFLFALLFGEAES
jgi:hypothetical protein